MFTLRFALLGTLLCTLSAVAYAALCLPGCSRMCGSTAIGMSPSVSPSVSPSKSPSTPEPVSAADAAVKQRRFQFVYAGTINKITPGARARVWLPVAQSGVDQTITLQDVRRPALHRLTTEKQFGNKLIFFEATANEQGEIPVEVHYLVERKEVRKDDGKRGIAELSDVEVRKFLAAASNIPVDGSLLNELLHGKKPAGPTLDVARVLYEAVDERMKYDKPTGQAWGRGNARWACGAGFGNCTDFHSLFIAVCRDSKIPAKFEIGFPIPGARQKGTIGGYHCWAKFYDEATKRWIAVDISEADKNASMKEYYFGNLTADRVTFSTGRDLQLVPRQQAGPVNFLVYPYVEVAGKPHASFTKAFRYENVE